MVINGVAIEKACEGDADTVRDAAAGYLVKLGYGLVDRSGARVHLKFAGSWLTADPDKHTHHAYVTAKDGVIHFEFGTGIVASYWGEADRAWADARAEAAARAARGSVSGVPYRGDDEHPMRACPYCGKINLVQAAQCSCCGASAPR